MKRFVVVAVLAGSVALAVVAVSAGGTTRRTVSTPTPQETQLKHALFYLGKAIDEERNYRTGTPLLTKIDLNTAASWLGFASDELGKGGFIAADSPARVDIGDARTLDKQASENALAKRPFAKELAEALPLKRRALAILKKLQDSMTAPANPTPPASNAQTPCSNQNNYDPKFPDFTQLHEYCGKAVTALTIHASVPLTGAGWYGPVINQPACTKTDPSTATCANITKLPKLLTFIVYASHPGGWPAGDSASATFTFADGTKQTESFYTH